MRSGGIHLVLITLALSALLAGCGGSDDPRPLSKAQFQRHAKALCLKRSRQYYEEALAASRKAQPEGEALSLSAESKIVAETVVPGMERKMEAVRALEPPPADAAQVDRILTAIEDVVSQARANPKGFIYRQVHFKRPFHHANELAKEYGLSACARA